VLKAFAKVFRSSPSPNNLVFRHTKPIAKVHLKLKANAASVVSKLGGGAHGLLGLILPPATYATLTNAVFNTPVIPGTTPNIEAGGTAVQIHEIVRQHKENLRVWREYNATDKALQQQLINTFDKPYIRGLRDRHTSYNNVSAMQILTHLYTTFGVITPIDIENNDAKMRAPFDPTQPIELLFDQIGTAIKFAGAGNRPYNPDQVVSRAYLLILQTGLYSDACRDWRRRAVLTQTWPNFKADFAKAHRDLRIVQTAAHSAGYQNANSAVEDLEPDYRRETTELPIPALPYAARQVHLFPALSCGALLSICQLCDHGCQAVFNASTVNIIKNHKTILQGQRNPTNGMWVIQLPAPSEDTSPNRLPPYSSPSPVVPPKPPLPRSAVPLQNRPLPAAPSHTKRRPVSWHSFMPPASVLPH
jgi:hypothetical protein